MNEQGFGRSFVCPVKSVHEGVPTLQLPGRGISLVEMRLEGTHNQCTKQGQLGKGFAGLWDIQIRVHNRSISKPSDLRMTRGRSIVLIND